MAGITLSDLGLSQEEIAERVIDRIAQSVLNDEWFDEDGGKSDAPSAFRNALEKKVTEKIDAAIETVAAKNVLPNVAAYVEGLVLQQTNQWGERTGKPVTFTEYLVQRAEAFMSEEVDYNGKTKGQGDSYSWKKAGTRVATLINNHLQYSIETAMKQALANANSAIVGGLESAVKIKLQEVAASLKVNVAVK